MLFNSNFAHRIKVCVCVLWCIERSKKAQMTKNADWTKPRVYISFEFSERALQIHFPFLVSRPALLTPLIRGLTKFGRKFLFSIPSGGKQLEQWIPCDDGRSPSFAKTIRLCKVLFVSENEENKTNKTRGERHSKRLSCGWIFCLISDRSHQTWLL